MVAHSPLGASSAERWMNCPGSVALIKFLHLPETDDPDYRAEGTAAHEMVERCLVSGQDAWELLGEKAENGVEFTIEMANAVQMHLDHVREIMGGVALDPHTFVEVSLQSDLHPLMFGTVDFGRLDVAAKTLYVRDYKHGVGVAVDAEGNPQIRYYAFMLLERLSQEDIEWVSMGIVQPRAFHEDGPIRIAPLVSAAEIRAWAQDVLKPAMELTAIDDDLDAGEWCRFCPAKLVCPLMVSLFGAAAKADPQTVVNLTNDSIDRDFKYVAAVKQYLKALEAEAFRRLMDGTGMTSAKLVKQKVNRVYKEGAEGVFKANFGDQAYTTPEMKSPAEMEKIGDTAKRLVKEYAYSPEASLTIAPAGDKRAAQTPPKSIDVFGAAVAAMGETT